MIASSYLVHPPKTLDLPQADNSNNYFHVTTGAPIQRGPALPVAQSSHRNIPHEFG
jgi:hypothetical protein